ncbi:P-loop NTPase family protein [Methylomonas albis]|uniref:KAP NTPase domain-containing protein n=1 Tax=Methylomonas albis TaxID=1854563 RepID=A0ABR9CZV6_9GAMM|nr:hypothetical protein [Methylomonas albis]MBD9356383.1 hypothetical protein [Methylomonas albis]
MSIEVVRKRVFDFLKTDTPEVLAISGEWGVGKTYSWDDYLITAKNKNAIALDRYAYVSLFGINSLSAFKYALFESIVNKNLIGKRSTVESFKENATAVSKSLGRKIGPWLINAPVLKNFSTQIESVSFLSISNTLICIDDLERAGKDLKLQDVLGLVSLLKEQKKCKVVLLVNDDDSNQGISDYKIYREKVVDVDLKFEPTSFDCASIVYKGDDYNSKKLIEFTSKLGIKNIRILKKIERLALLGMPCLNGFDEEVKYQFLHSLALFTYCNYSNIQSSKPDPIKSTFNSVPTLKFVTNLGYNAWGIGDDKELTGEQQAWKSFLSEYGYNNTDDFDLVIADAVVAGYFMEDNLKEKAQALNEHHSASKSKSSFTETWRLFHDSFDDNQSQVINCLYESFKRNAKHITPNNLNGTVMLFKELGEFDKALELLEYYITLRKDETGLFNIENHNFFGDICDQDVISRFNEIYAESKAPEEVKDILRRIGSSNSWNQSDTLILSNIHTIDYYNIFKSDGGIHYIEPCLKFGQCLNPGDHELEITNKAKEALLMIAKESKLNELRVKKFGIKIDA